MTARRLTAAVLSAVVIAGCSPPGDGDAGSEPAAQTPRTSQGPGRPGGATSDAQRLSELPVVPDVRRPRQVAQRLRLLGAVLGDPDAAPAAVGRAAELEQVTTRTLALRPDVRLEEVLRQLPPRLRAKVRRDVVAARALGVLAQPQPQLPDWRLVPPPPRPRLVSAYRATQRRLGVPWEYLAGIHLVETRMGRIRGVSTAGAQGPMQFLPTTWDIYGAGGDITDVEDAVMAAGRLLRANGAPGDMDAALYAYNQSSSYVLAVTSYAANMREAPLAYRGYWHWRVLYRHVTGTKVLPVGYPRRPAVPLGRS